MLELTKASYCSNRGVGAGSRTKSLTPGYAFFTGLTVSSNHEGRREPCFFYFLKHRYAYKVHSFPRKSLHAPSVVCLTLTTLLDPSSVHGIFQDKNTGAGSPFPLQGSSLPRDLSSHLLPASPAAGRWIL